MPRHLIGAAHELINELPVVHAIGVPPCRSRGFTAGMVVSAIHDSLVDESAALVRELQTHIWADGDFGFGIRRSIFDELAALVRELQTHMWTDDGSNLVYAGQNCRGVIAVMRSSPVLRRKVLDVVRERCHVLHIPEAQAGGDAEHVRADADARVEDLQPETPRNRSGLNIRRC